MTTSCPRCGGTVAAIGHDEAKCAMCGRGGSHQRAPTAQDKIDARHTGWTLPPINALDRLILDGALSDDEFQAAVAGGWWGSVALKRRLRQQGRL